MGSLEPKHVEMALWFSFGVLGVSSLYIAYQKLLEVKFAALVTREDKSPEIISQRTEDAISTSTLGDILNSPNYDIRQAAIKIIMERATRNETYKLLIRNIRSPDTESRDMALASLRFLCTSSVQDTICTFETFKVLIDLLRKFIPEVKKRTHLPDTDWKDRTQAEKDILFVLDHLIHNDLREALRAGLVSRWLAHYPFGGPLKSEERKWQVLSRLKSDHTDDISLSGIITQLNSSPDGRFQLRKYGLINEAEETTTFSDEILDMMRRGISQRRADREESEEEQALRRRRRQAMVISEAGQPLSGDNIYEGLNSQPPGGDEFGELS